MPLGQEERQPEPGKGGGKAGRKSRHQGNLVFHQKQIPPVPLPVSGSLRVALSSLA